MDTYKIVRMFQHEAYHSQVIKRGLTLEEAQAHCNDPETSSSTCKTLLSLKVTDRYGDWFDGYEKEGK